MGRDGKLWKVQWEDIRRRLLYELGAERYIERIEPLQLIGAVRLDRKATSISLLVVLGIRRDGQKVLLAVCNMGGESEAAWRSLLDELASRGLTAPNFVIVDGAAGLEKSTQPSVAQRADAALHRA